MSTHTLAEKLARAQAAAERLAAPSLSEAEAAIAYVGELRHILAERLAVLRGAAIDAGLVPGDMDELPPAAVSPARHHGAYLRQTPDAHQVVHLVLNRWDEIVHDAQDLHAAAVAGRADEARVAAFKTKALFLTKIPLLFSRHQNLAQIFTDKVQEGGKLGTGRLRDRTIIRTLNPGAKSGTLVLLRPKLTPGSMNVAENARLMVKDLDASMRIFEAVCDPSPANVLALEPRARDKAAILATALLKDLDRRDKLVHYVTTFDQLRGASSKGPFVADELQALMLELSGMPADFEGFQPVEAILG